MLVEDKVNSSLRIAVRRQHLERFNPTILDSIRDKRVLFKWLPVTYITDLEQGAIYWIAASVVSVLIPVFPLCSLYEHWWPTVNLIPRPDHVTVYCFLVWMGICYTIGSILFHRAVRHPPVPPLCSWTHFRTDELHAMWWFFFGTIPSVPCSAIYCFHNGPLGQYGLALALCIIASVVMEIAVFASYPIPDGEEHREWFAPIVHRVFPIDTVIGKYCHNDWLVISWAFLLVSIGSDLVCLVIMLYWCGQYDPSHADVGDVGREIYSFGTGLFDSLLFTVGCLYMLSGSIVHRDYTQSDIEGGDRSDSYKEIMSLQQAAMTGTKKPIAHEHELLSVVLVRDHDQASEPRKSPAANDEPEDDIPAAEGDSSQFTATSGSNRYSLNMSKKEFSL